MLKDENLADKKLTVGSIEVLNDLTGKGLRRIQRRIDQTANSVSVLAGQMDQSWRDAAADNRITPSEKKTLKKQLGEISQTYAAIIATAEEKHLEEDEKIIALTTKYTALVNYLDLVRMFDDMSVTTEIESGALLSLKYDEYFSAQTYAQALLAGTTTAAEIRSLVSLLDDGTEGEIAYYQGQLYKRHAGYWVVLSAADYAGIYNTSTPEITEGRFFLCGADFIEEHALWTTRGYLELDDGSILAVRRKFHKGEIYVCKDDVWEHDSDHNDWRYLLATLDLSKIGSPVSPQLDVVVNGAEGVYRGILIQDITTPLEGDFYMYNGEPTTERLKGYLYLYKSGAWRRLRPEDPENFSYYMRAAGDSFTAAEGSTDPGLFALLYARTLVASSAFIGQLQTKELNIQNGGRIRSGFNGNFDDDGKIIDIGTTGTAIDSLGNFVTSQAYIRGTLSSNGINLKRITAAGTVGQIRNTILPLIREIKSNPLLLNSARYYASGEITLTSTIGSSTYTINLFIDSMDIGYILGGFCLRINIKGGFIEYTITPPVSEASSYRIQTQVNQGSFLIYESDSIFNITVLTFEASLLRYYTSGLYLYDAFETLSWDSLSRNYSNLELDLYY